MTAWIDVIYTVESPLWFLIVHKKNVIKNESKQNSHDTFDI